VLVNKVADRLDPGPAERSLAEQRPGDIGVPVSDAPMDFSAWFEVYLGGRCYTLDARNNIWRIGRVLIARGRDAADVAISTTFGPNTLSSFSVWTEEVAAP